MKLAFIGLGNMGFPMAGHLAQHNYTVSVYNRSANKSKAWVDLYSGDYKNTPAEAAASADVVFCCVGDDSDVREVVLGKNGAIHTMQPGAIVIDHTTTSANLAREMSIACKAQQLHFLDAPVSGGEPGAKKGTLTVMCGGDHEVYTKVLPLLKSYAHQICLMGPVGTGQLTKMVNQICIAGVLAGLSEGLNFAEQAGLDIKQVVPVISKGAAQSWQMDNRYETMAAAEYNHGFAVDWMRKDLSICLQEAKNNNSNLSVVALVDQFYQDVQNMGGGQWDTSSLLARLKK